MLTKNIEKMKTEVAQHIAADAVIQGDYWREGQGCFIGCLTHSDRAENVTEKFNMPTALVRVCEHIFEDLSAQDAKEFFEDIPHAIGSDGKNLGCVVWKLLEAELRALPKVDSRAQAVIDPVIDGMVLLGSGKEWPNSKESHAEADAAADALATTADTASTAATKAAAAAAAFASTAATKAASTAATFAAFATAAAAVDAISNVASTAADDFYHILHAYDAYDDYDAYDAYDAATKRQRDTVLDLIKKAPVEA